ncbi:hypothetical protein M514_03109 [Trichuris suis]|uniref:Uncharacterized protein n=1 Tax=Trichuris suis TaxID=68888 RepID=A0A085MFI9_9BILA|nr:hypothetical protein M513_03109 [Trichuris suis]KFD68258.1 hypothetical protein M514_03109 [Trichuris suis]
MVLLESRVTIGDDVNFAMSNNCSELGIKGRKPVTPYRAFHPKGDKCVSCGIYAVSSAPAISRPPEHQLSDGKKLPKKPFPHVIDTFMFRGAPARMSAEDTV